MLQLRLSWEHCNTRHPTHLQRASAPTEPCAGGPWQSIRRRNLSHSWCRWRGTQVEMRAPSGGDGGLSWPRLTASRGLWERCFTAQSFLVKYHRTHRGTRMTSPTDTPLKKKGKIPWYVYFGGAVIYTALAGWLFAESSPLAWICIISAPVGFYFAWGAWKQDKRNRDDA